MAGEQGKVGTSPQTGLQLSRLPVRPERGQGQTNRRTLADLDRQDQNNTVGYSLPGLTSHVPHRSTHSNIKASPLRATTHETHTVALEKQLEGPRITGKGDPCPQVPPPPSKVVAGGKQCATRSTITPSKTCSANFYRRIKRRVGRSLRRAHCKGNLVPSTKQAAHKLLRAKSSISSSKKVSNPLLQQDSTDCYRQHNSGCLYQQRGGGGGGMKSGSLCALLWRILSWCTRQQVTLKARHIPGRLNVIADKLSRLGQTIQTEWSLHPEVFQVVFSKYSFWWDRVGMDISGRVPGYSRQWTIIGDSTKISTFTNLKLTQIIGSNHLLYISSATFFALKTVRHRRNVNQENISVHSKHGCLLQCP